MTVYQSSKTRTTRVVSVTIQPTPTHPQMPVLRRLWQREPQTGQSSRPHLTSRWTRTGE
jgi:hypothetical protein